MLLLNEIIFLEDNRKEEGKILVNPHQIVTGRQRGIYTSINTTDHQEIKVKESIFNIKKLLEKDDLSLVDSKVVTKESQ